MKTANTELLYGCYAPYFLLRNMVVRIVIQLYGYAEPFLARKEGAYI